MSGWEQYYQRWARLKKNFPPPEPVPDLGEMLGGLLEFSDEQWGRYAFRRELLRGKFSDEEKASLTRRALACGDEYAEKTAGRFASRDPVFIAGELGASVSYPQRPGGGVQAEEILFARFTEPDKIEVFTDCIDRAEETVESGGLTTIFGDVSFGNILLSHEIFHLLELRHEKEIFTRTEKIDLLPLKIIHNWSRIRCLGEIAAMRFSKTLLNLRFSPYILDVFLLYLYNPEAAAGLYRGILKLLSPLPIKS